ncbi:MAG: YqgE/AlgH family protein [Candidatus Didemnitutus sp.]|nr:YqgE/AlgH family protein [Candidatus Didemnitutus sp.]
MKPRRSNPKESFAGSLLLSHPAMKDPNFGRTVVLMSAHDADGALGVVINRPLRRRLDEISPDFALSPLAKVPLYTGGPVETQKLILAAWRWRDESGEFELQFGLDPERATALVAEPGYTLRGFLGYSGWGKGQLENEMKQNTWFVAGPANYNLGAEDGPALWRLILGSLDPELKLLADEPDDPSKN